MFWELTATVIAGLGAAGLVLGLRKIWPRLPKGIVPAAAGVGMLLFQIINEYQWYKNIEPRLPGEVEVIATYPARAWYKPWSYVFPAVGQFVAVDRASNTAWQGQNDWRQSRLYFFERRVPVQSWPILIDCPSARQANLPQDGQAPDWQHATHSAALAAALCENR